jgi:hypothetical protein
LYARRRGASIKLVACQCVHGPCAEVLHSYAGCSTSTGYSPDISARTWRRRGSTKAMSAALGVALLWMQVPVAAVVTVHNNSNCCCQNIYPRSAANLVSTVDECIASCHRDALCHAAIMISTDVKGQCQLTGPAPAGKSCCIHKPHFDGLSAVPATAGETTIDMGTSPGGTGCQCKSSGWDVPCAAPVPAGCMMYRGSGSGVFGPCSSVGPPLPSAPNYDQAHRPIFHLTPEKGHNNDPVRGPS